MKVFHLIDAAVAKSSCRPDLRVARAFCIASLCVLPMLALHGCASRQMSVLAVAKSLVQNNEAIDSAVLRPDFRYLRVTINNKSVLMVLGYVDADSSGRPIQVWFSADGEVVRTQYGRLVGLIGAPIEWRQVTLSADVPAWSDITNAHQYQYVRQLDEMPGYRWSQVDHLTIRPISVATDTELKGSAAASLQWFEEVAVDGRLPAARYALVPGAREPVYGEQCVSASFCMSWQVWPPVVPPHPSQ